MTEEENKAIEEFKRVIDFVSSGTGIVEIRKFDVHYYETILNLIEKLEKENKELKEKVFKRDKELIRLEEYANKNFERKDDVAIIKARNEKEAKKILEKDVNLDIVKDYTLTRVKIPLTKYHDKHIYFISEY